MNPPKRPQKRAPSCTSPFAGVAVNLALAITIIIARPLAHAVTDGRMGRMTATIALPCIGIQRCAARWDVGGDQGVAGPRVRMIAHPEAVLTRLPRHHTQNRWAIVGRGPMPLALVRASTWRVMRGAMWGAFFPPRAGSVRRLHTWLRSSARLAPYGSGAFAPVAGGSAVACATRPARGPSAPSVPPWPCPAAGAPASLAVGGSSRTRCQSGACRSRRSPGSERPESHVAGGTAAALCSRSLDTVPPQDGGGAPARGCRCSRRAIQQSESQSCRDDITSCTVARHEPKFL
jgi:hypothetical protein